MPKLSEKHPTRRSVLIDVPLAEVPMASWGLHINTRLTPEQSFALRRVTAALDEQQARLSNDQRIVTASGTLKYLLEQIISRDESPQQVQMRGE